DADQKGIEARPCDAVASRLRISACSSLLACSMVAPGRSLAIRSTSLRAPSRDREVRRHTHDRERLLIDYQPASDRVGRAAVPALPQTIADHDHVPRPG